MTDQVSVEEFKQRAEFFKAGHIVPRRILAISDRKQQHRLKFGKDCWVRFGKKGYVVFCPGDGAAIKISLHPSRRNRATKLGTRGSIYAGTGLRTVFYGGHPHTSGQQAKHLAGFFEFGGNYLVMKSAQGEKP